MYQKSKLHDVRFLWYEVRQNFVILGHFSLFYPSADPENQNFEKLKKKTRRYYHFTDVDHKGRSDDVWILRYGGLWTEFFVILDHFFPFSPLTTFRVP